MTNTKRFMLSMLIFLIAALVPLVAYAQTPVPPAPPDLTVLLQLAMALFASLVGFPAALSLALNILMKLNWLSAVQAAWVSFGASAVVFVGLIYLVLTGQTSLVQMIDAAFGGLAKLLADITVILGIPTIMLVLTGKFTRGIAEHSSHFAAAFAIHNAKKK